MLPRIEPRVRAQDKRTGVGLQVAQQVHSSRGRVRHKWPIQFHTSTTRSSQIGHVFAAHCALIREYV